jgi:hypothetical protein
MPAVGPEGSRPLPDLPVPRPEHPRPDLRRPLWENLNGPWEFRFDPDDRGRQEHWEQPGVQFPETILVPFPWESPAAWGEAARADDRTFYHAHAFREPIQDPGDPVLDGAWRHQHAAAARQEIGWYRRRLRVPAAWRRPGQRVFLCVGAADWEATVYCNGLLAGSHAGGYAPFAVELTPFLGPADGEDVVAIRVQDPRDNGEQPGGKQHGWYERTSGIWQTVYLECRPEAHLTHLRVTPDVAGKRALVEVGLCPVAGDYEVRVAASSPEGELYTAQGVCPGCERRTLELPLGPHPTLWSPEDPALYELTVEIAAPAAGPEAVDRVHSFFGMRSIGSGTLPGSDTPCLMLNGRPFYVRAALHQSFHPAGVYAYVRDEIIADDLRAAKAAGLNALRVHIKVDDPRLYYWADRLGLAILYDFPNTAVQTPRARRLWEETLRAGIARDANHPSIVLWVLFNETWGLGRDFRENRDTQEWVAAMVALCRRLDPSRPVEDNSPCNYDHVETAVNSWHFYINDYQRARAHVEEAVARTHPGSGWNFVPGRTQDAQPLLNSEYGGIGAGMGDRDVSHCLRWLTALLRRQERIVGYVYTELTDLEWEHNGLLRYDRLPKEFPYPLADVLGPDVLLVDAPPLTQVAPGDTLRLPLAVSVFSHDLADGEGVLHWRLEGTDTAGRHVHGATGRATAHWRRYRVTALDPLAVPVPAAAGVYQLHCSLRGPDGRLIARTQQDVQVGTAAPGLPALEAEGFRALRSQGDYWVGEGSGRVAFVLPPTGDTLVLEAAAGVFLPRQTDAERTPTRLRVRVDGRALGAFPLPDAPADARGTLSYAAGIPGAYGYLLRLPLPGGRPTAPVRVELAVDDGGLALFGPGCGRYLLGPQLV